MANRRWYDRHRVELLRLAEQNVTFADGGVIDAAEWRHQLHEDIDSGR